MKLAALSLARGHRLWILTAVKTAQAEDCWSELTVSARGGSWASAPGTGDPGCQDNTPSSSLFP